MHSLCARDDLCILKIMGVRRRANLFGIGCLLATLSCAPRVTHVAPIEARPGTTVDLPMRYLVGWPRVEIAGTTMTWPDLKLGAANPDRKNVAGEDLVWIEDKILQFTVPMLAPGDYQVMIHDDKGPPGDGVYAVLETAAYLLFPPVWPFVLRSNQTQVTLRVLP